MKREDINKLSLEQYNAKYRNCKEKLLKFTKKEVEDFDNTFGHYNFNNKKFNLQHNNFLLKDRKWCLIGDTYFEIPKPPRFVWFRNLNAAIQIASCGVFCVGVSSIVVFPTLANTVWKAKENKPGPTPKPPKDEKWMEKSNWYDLTSNADEDDIGKTIKVKVNGVDHEVRLIDIDKDQDQDGNTIHTTWDFVNLISDEYGYSLAYQFRDCEWGTQSEPFPSLDYHNSSLNFALNGSGNNAGKQDKPDKKDEILVARYNVNQQWEGVDSIYRKPVIDMLPKELTDKMKKVSKVNNDKLFVLSSTELQGKYSFYDSKTVKGRIRRIKKQVNNDAVIDAAKSIPSGSGQTTERSVAAHCGRNNTTDIDGLKKEGSYYWCRDFYGVSPSSSINYQYGIRINPRGVPGHACPQTDAYCVAPAFCI